MEDNFIFTKLGSKKQTLTNTSLLSLMTHGRTNTNMSVCDLAKVLHTSFICRQLAIIYQFYLQQQLFSRISGCWWYILTCLNFPSREHSIMLANAFWSAYRERERDREPVTCRWRRSAVVINFNGSGLQWYSFSNNPLILKLSGLAARVRRERVRQNTDTACVFRKFGWSQQSVTIL